MDARLKVIDEMVQGIEEAGLAGLRRVVAIYRDPDPNSPSADCISDTDAAMDSAVGDEQYYDAVLGQANCLRNTPPVLAPIDPEPEDPEPPEDPGDTAPEDEGTLGDLVLAALLAHLGRQARA